MNKEKLSDERTERRALTNQAVKLRGGRSADS